MVEIKHITISGEHLGRITYHVLTPLQKQTNKQNCQITAQNPLISQT